MSGTNLGRIGVATVLFVAALLTTMAGVCGGNDAAGSENATTVSTLRVARDPHAFATLNREFLWELVWQPERPIPAGTQIELRSHNLRTSIEWTYTKVEVEGDAGVSWRRGMVASGQALSTVGQNGLALVRASLSKEIAPGGRLVFRLTAVPPYWSDLEDAVGLWLAAPAASDYVAEPRASVVLRAGPGPVERLAVYCHPTPDAGGKVRTVLAPEDRFGNLSEFQRETPLQLTWNGKTWTETLKASKTIELDAPADVGRLAVAVESKALSLDDNIGNGRRDGGRIVVLGNPVWREGPGGKIAAFGEFHWHSEFSGDGVGTLDDAMRLARDHLNMDYCVGSDHTPGPEPWDRYVAAMDRWNAPDRFATMYGWENSTDTGHENYYFLDANHPMKPLKTPGIAGGRPFEIQEQLDRLQAGLAGDERFLAIPHHTNCVSESLKPDGTPYWFAYRFTRPDNFHRLIELFQCRGNQERNEYTDAWRGWYTNGASAQDALAAGYELGFTGGTDCHVGRPGRCFAWLEGDRGRLPLHSQALTGLWTDRIERRAVWNALFERHTWAVWDTRALIDYSVAGARSGDEISVAKGSPLRAHIRLSAEDSLQSLEIVSNKKTVWSTAVDPLDFEADVELGPAGDNAYFYLRGLQCNGGILYASPVFVHIR